jgi:hypothetical protein
MQQMGFAAFTNAVAVTPSDTTQVKCRAIYVGGAGNVAVKMVPGGTAVTFTAPPVGTILPLEINDGQIMSTNTTATLLIALS